MNSSTSKPSAIKAIIGSVSPGSVAHAAGLRAGWTIHLVNDEPLCDTLDWLWHSNDMYVELLVSASGLQAEAESISLHREPGESWGISFEEPFFDGLKTCVNSCSFCFLNMLPAGLRPSLYQRDDDYRLSFLQGSYVTLSNVDARELNRIMVQRISPLHVSLHAVDPECRKLMMGKNAQVGFDNLEALLAEGIQCHVQIVLVPDINDGVQLDKTLAWVEQRPNILSVGIVPYAYTKFAHEQKSFTPEQARQLIDKLQVLAPRVQLSDEWFVLADLEPMPTTYYGSYPQYENGIGMIRSFLNNWERIIELTLARVASLPQSSVVPAINDMPLTSRHQTGRIAQESASSGEAGAKRFILVTGMAFGAVLKPLIANSKWATNLYVLPVQNQFFGGSVNVAGLLTASDIISALGSHRLPEAFADAPVLLPSIMFNDDGLTLDENNLPALQYAIKHPVHVVTYT